MKAQEPKAIALALASTKYVRQVNRRDGGPPLLMGSNIPFDALAVAVYRSILQADKPVPTVLKRNTKQP